jgi:hypothetical protein
MIIGKKEIQAYFQTIGKPYFAVFTKNNVEKGNSIFRNDKDELEYDYSQASLAFDKLLQYLSHGDYTIVIGDKKDVTARGNNRVDFKIPIVETGTPVSNSPAIAGLTMDEVERRAATIADERFQALMQKKDLEEAKEKIKILEKENKELEKKSSDPINKFLTAAAPHSEAIISGILGKPIAKPMPISGIKPDSEGEFDLEAQTVTENFIQALAAAKPDNWKEILRKVTALITEQPEKFETVLKFL